MYRCSMGLLLALAVVATFGVLVHAGLMSTPTLAGITAYPDEAYLSPGFRQRLRVYGYDRHGKPLPLLGPVRWASDGRAGSVTPDGVFTARRDRSATGVVTVTAPGGFSSRVRVMVEGRPAPAHGAVAPLGRCRQPARPRRQG